MKQLFLFFILSFGSISCDCEEIVPIANLPQEVSSYVATHFPQNPIIQAVVDKDGLKLTYDVTLEGGFFLEFNRNKKVIDIEGITKLPDSVIPTQLLSYVVQNYPTSHIIGWEIERGRQEIKLNTGIELVFSANGNYIGIDN